MTNRILFSLLILFMGVPLAAQNSGIVRSFEQTTDHIPGNDRRNDLNGEPCALIKIYAVDDIDRIEGNKIGDIIKRGNVEKWVYMCKGSRNIRIHFSNHLPVKVMFQDYHINGLESNRVYELVVDLPQSQKPTVASENIPPERVELPQQLHNESGLYNDINQGYRSVEFINYRFDYSRMKIDSQDPNFYFSHQTRKRGKPYFSSFQSFTDELEKVFVSSANNNSLISKGYVLDNTHNSKWNLVICPLEIDEDGEHRITGILTDKVSGRQAGSFTVHVGGGRSNLFKQLYKRFEKSGEEFGDKLADDILR